MRLVVLDGYALNPGDLSWDALTRLGDCVIHDRTPPAEIVARSAGAAVLLTNKTPLSAGTLAQLPDLRYIGVLATGHNVVDSAAARARCIPVTNIPAYGTRSVAQHVFALILEHTQHVGLHAAGVREGRWSRNADFCYWDRPLVELDGLTLGIIGFGRIGQAVARIGAAFGMRVITHSRRPVADAENLPLEEIFRQSDYLSLHCPLTPETQGLINATRLALMKPSAVIVNTGRGPLVVEDDLAAALQAGRIGGALLDVLSAEPPHPENPLLRAPNCLITPHQAWATQAARSRLLATAIDNLHAWLAGTPLNVVNA
jgi:glycerate dehydrogenase